MTYALTYRDLEPAVRGIGRELLAVSRRRRSAEDRVIDLTLRWPAARARLFQLVDAFPALRGPDDVAAHVSAYLDHRSVPAALRLLVRAAGRVPGGDAIEAAVARLVITQMAGRFIAGHDVTDATDTFAGIHAAGMGLIVDLLGEKTITAADADRYATRVLDVIAALAPRDQEGTRRSIAVKPTAVAPRLHPLTAAAGLTEAEMHLRPVLDAAAVCGLTVWLDMEQYEVKDLTLELFRRLVGGPGRLGVVVQAYLRDSHQDLQELIAWAGTQPAGPHRACVRLVKGAYWDTETVVARAHGWPVPVYEHKADTDANFERCTRLLLEHTDLVDPAFASHNVRSLAHAMAIGDLLGRPRAELQFQMLHGMEGGLAAGVRRLGPQVDIYAPIGDLVPGMSYLVRRLLENSSNESFVRQSSHASTQDQLTAPRSQEVAA